MVDTLHLQPLIISAPFGNYIQPIGCTATLGTFTASARPGRVMQVLRTVRHYRRPGAWVNRIGLRNPGIAWLAERVRGGKIDAADKIVSIHGFTGDDWQRLLERIAELRPLAVELNMSCPNVGEVNWPNDLFRRAVETSVPVIVKIPPVQYEEIVADAMRSGVRWLHCCNTLPIPAGGMSGKPLKPVALQCIRMLRKSLDRGIGIIGGGGITEPADLEAYAQAGADRFAIATKVFHPRYLWTHRPLQGLMTAAKQIADRADAR